MTPPVSSPAPSDAAIGLPARAAALLDATEPEVLHTVDAAVTQYGWVGLYQLASHLGVREILRRTRGFVVYVDAATRSHPEMRKVVHRFLCALLGDMDGVPAAQEPQDVFRRLMRSGEYAARKLVCSLLEMARYVRDAIDRSLVPGA